MKKLFFVLCLSLTALFCHGQEVQVKTGPVIQFEEKILDFGVISQGDTVEHVFVFENTGTMPLKILSARGSCGCTVPKYSKEAVKPGAKGEVFVRFRSAGKMGKQNKTVTLVTNAPANNRVVLSLRGTIKQKGLRD